MCAEHSLQAKKAVGVVRVMVVVAEKIGGEAHAKGCTPRWTPLTLHPKMVAVVSLLHLNHGLTSM
jgi:hypothetical protein